MQIRTCSIPHVKSWPFDQSEQFSQKDKHNIINITTCIWNKEKSENCKHALKKKVYLSKAQIQHLCELYQEEEHLWNIQSLHYDEQHAFVVFVSKHAPISF